MLFETLCAVLRFHRIDVTNLRGQCYDGASNVAGIWTGLQARIKEISLSALFVHCYAHVLNLVIVDAMTSNTMHCKGFLWCSSELVRFHSNMYQTTCYIYTVSSNVRSMQIVVLRRVFKFARWRACVKRVGPAEQMPLILSTRLWRQLNNLEAHPRNLDKGEHCSWSERSSGKHWFSIYFSLESEYLDPILIFIFYVGICLRIAN